MDPDLAMAIGMVLGVFSIPSILSAFSEGRPPRVAAFTLIASGGLVVWAINNKPGGYSFGDLPEVLVRVIARYVG
ncbi:hypothetical protein [Roseovarius sp. BRH_c41]|jgi:hypothetical protein|uniref:hypothetical protein n=1 Tax=Roseovarius sp. BRH_c41 TaxID=1629709 RepID=UPI0005F1C79F|nr:hypothetical protein [Roseovarius sp. BRH_c41]KJS40626.1 MAG: hypothetical protein VR71_21775 [Roseovarius sp. BRH_c41]